MLLYAVPARTVSDCTCIRMFVVVIVYCVVVHWMKTSFFCHYIRTCFSSQVITLVVVFFSYYLLLMPSIPRNNETTTNIHSNIFITLLSYIVCFFFLCTAIWILCVFSLFLLMFCVDGWGLFFHVNSFHLYTYINKYFFLCFYATYNMYMLNIKEQK